MSLEDESIKSIINAHLEAFTPECRWCFAIDLHRIPGKLITKYDFTDGNIFRYSCPRCGGEFTYYSEGFEQDYLKNLVLKLRPELIDSINDNLLHDIATKVFPEYIEH